MKYDLFACAGFIKKNSYETNFCCIALIEAPAKR